MGPIPSIFTLSAAAAIVAAVAFFVVQRFIKPIDMNEHQGFLDAMLSIVGTLVSILLGLLVAAALEDYQALETSIDNEAASVAHVFRLTAGLPVESRKPIQSLCVDYCDAVVKEEWPLMAKGETSKHAFVIMLKLVKQAVTFQPQTEGQNNLHAELLSSVSEIVDCRRQRILVLHSNWTRHLMPVLLMCSVIVLAFAYLYARRGSILHGVLICLVAVALGGNLALVYLLRNPFSSDWAIQPRGFVLNAKIHEEIQAAPELRDLLNEEAGLKPSRLKP